MLEDALLDLTDRGDFVIDPFLGSGSTLMAAEKTGRVCRGVELDPLHVDVIVRRFEAAIGQPAVLAETGELFDALAARRAREAAPVLCSDQGRADIADEATRNPMGPRHQERAGEATSAHFQLIANMAATAARGTTAAHEPMTAIAAETAQRIETRCSISPTSFDCE